MRERGRKGEKLRERERDENDEDEDEKSSEKGWETFQEKDRTFSQGIGSGRDVLGRPKCPVMAPPALPVQSRGLKFQKVSTLKSLNEFDFC